MGGRGVAFAVVGSERCFAVFVDVAMCSFYEYGECSDQDEQARRLCVSFLRVRGPSFASQSPVFELVVMRFSSGSSLVSSTRSQLMAAIRFCPDSSNA